MSDAFAFFGMRNEDYDRELLVAVTLFCVVFAIAANSFDATPSAALPVGKTTDNIQQTAPSAVRVIGTPIVPNTNPSVR